MRDKGTSAATFSNWANNAIIAYITPKLIYAMGAYMYLIFGTTGFVMALFVYVVIPETMGKSLEEMDELFS
jgi:hypothetical protein